MSTGPAGVSLGPDSFIWRLGFPRSSLLLAGRALLLQVAHPTVGAGVRDHSDLLTDPWGRLDRTVRSLLAQLYGGPASVAEAERLQRLHGAINGTGFSGAAYRALEPRAYAWVHLANFDTIVTYHDHFGHPLDGDRRDRFYAEWCQVGGLLGIADRDLPPNLDALADYLDEMVTSTLGDNVTVRVLLESLSLRTVPTPTRLLPTPMWRALKPLGRSLLHDGTVGTLPSVLRDKLGLSWTADDARRLDRIARRVRTIEAGMPDRLVHYGPAYRAMRSAEAAGGGSTRNRDPVDGGLTP